MTNCSCSDRVIFIDTPQAIYDRDNVDVFEQIIPDTAYQYQKKREELWNRYRYRGLGSCDQKYWIQCMKDRYGLIEETWDIKIKAWEQYRLSVASSIDFSAGSYETNTVSEREDTPDNPAGTTVYLSDRATTAMTGKTYDGLESQTVDDYIKYVPDPWDGFATEFSKLFCFTI